MLTLISINMRASSTRLLKNSSRSFHISQASQKLYKLRKSNLKTTKRIAEKFYTQKASAELTVDDGKIDLNLSGNLKRRAHRNRPSYWPHEAINELIDNYIGEPVATNSVKETFVNKTNTTKSELPIYDMKDINKSHIDLDYSSLFQNKSIAKSLNLTPAQSSSDLITSSTPSQELQMKEVHELNDHEAIDKHNDKIINDYFAGLEQGIPRTRKSRGLYRPAVGRRSSSSSNLSGMGIRMMDPEEAAKIDVFAETPKKITESLKSDIAQSKLKESEEVIKITDLPPVPNDSDVIRVAYPDDVRPVPLKFEGVYPDEPLEAPKTSYSSDFKVEPRIVKEVESRTAKKQVIRNTKPQSDKYNILFPSDDFKKQPTSSTSTAATAKLEEHKPLIFNVSMPKSKPQNEVSSHAPENSLEGFVNLNDSDKALKIESILNLVSDEMSNKDKKHEFEEEIKRSLQRLSEMKTEQAQSKNSIPDSMLDKELEIKKFQAFLRNANATKKRETEDHFRELRAYEWSKIMNDKNAHTFTKHNFFSPIDEKLIKSTINNSLNPNYSNFQNNEDAEALFPKYENQFMIKKAYLTVNCNDLSTPATESDSNPFGYSYKPPALLQLIRELSEDSNYKELVAKIDNLSLHSWKFIGIGHDSTLKNKVLVFEKIIDDNVEIRAKRLRILKRILGSALVVSTLVLGFSAMADPELLHYAVDENRNVQRIN
ncbi:hypothetical protein WICPIJ_000008 [Wickerhamomyces pijperi]|uniref:Uncharacterized protein n=1 Tax=Wickerhamomyces pijperi TaxID=599730 RepID=A0A9P8QI89_WICPI|nr:hypothetical protein WICPIJ_000008 [Wickerhamomyces pijperi]